MCTLQDVCEAFPDISDSRIIDYHRIIDSADPDANELSIYPGRARLCPVGSP